MDLNSLTKMSNGMSDENRVEVLKVLNKQLADHYVLLTKTKFYHWNVNGSHFHDLHLLFDEQYEIMAEIVDDIAEQALKLGGQSAGTLHWFKDHSRLKEDEGESIPSTKKMIENLKNDHEIIMTSLYEDINKVDESFKDAVTSNKLQDISDKHHKMAWVLRKITESSDLQ